MTAPPPDPALQAHAPPLDPAVARLLADGRGRVGPDALPALVAGVLAAPPARDGEAWMRLVVPAPDAETRRALDRFKAAMGPPAPGEEADEGDRAAATAERLAALRAELERRGLAGFLVPRADEHQGEYVAPRARRLAWLTGFTGSAGLAVVLRDRAALFVDGRYTIQVRDQVPPALFEPRHLIDDPPSDWVAAHLGPGDRLAYDPWLHTADGLERLRKAVGRAGAELVAVEDNPLDAVWTDQPPPPLAPVVPHDDAHAGRSSAEKRLEVAERVVAEGADVAVLTQPDSIAWLLNVRGGDVACTPLPLSFATIDRDGQVEWFVDRRKLVAELAAHLGNGVTVSPPDGLGPALDRLVGGGRKVLADPASAASWVFDRVAAAGGTVVRAADPCALPKARKNPVELDGTRAAHRRDGAAVTRFLAWLARETPGGQVDELAAAARLLAFRAEDPAFRDMSFETISGSGPNGAIVHYRSTPRTNRRLGAGELYLVDSGAQYLDGTTDITRTVAVGSPDGEMRDRFTRVLKGHIAIASQRFPRGTNGAQLDTLARAALWQVGLDYDHGTGHGVGSYLSVHEGPQRIAKSGTGTALEPGMIVSNEPGYYKTGAYGIRIENLVAVAAVDLPGAERPTLGFETLTLAPIDRALVEPALLTEAERAWLDAYHARVRETLAPLVDAATLAWLEDATAPIA